MSDGLFTRRFWRDALERILVTAAQCAFVAVPVTASLAYQVHWDLVAQAAILGAITSLIKAVAASRVGRPDSASLVD